MGLKYDSITRTYEELSKKITEEDTRREEEAQNAGASCPF